MKRIFSFVLRNKKTWIHYFFEFLLLFLAVFLGFLTENYRDNQEKNDQAEQYLNGIKLDVSLNQKRANEVIKDFEMRIQYLDSTINNFPYLLDRDVNEYVQLGERINAWEDFFPISSSYEQLKNGGFRLIKDSQIIDSVNVYYQHMDDILGETDNLTRHYRLMWDKNTEWFDYYQFDSINKFNTNKLNNLTLRNLIKPGTNNEVSAYYHLLKVVRGNLTGLITFHKNQIANGDRLITFIEDRLK